MLIWVWVASEIVIAIGTRAKGGSASVRDRGSLAILWTVIAAACFAGGWLGEVGLARIPISSHTAKVIGIVIVVAGLALRWTAILTLGKLFTANVAIHEGQTITRTGVYRYLRHPSYTGLWLAFAGLAFHYRDWVACSWCCCQSQQRCFTGSTLRKWRWWTRSAPNTKTIARPQAA